METTISRTIAGALYEAGVTIATCVPGSGGSEVFTDFNSLSRHPEPFSFHEEPAYSIAHGAAIAGVRSAVLVKSHGLVKAGNSVTDSLFCGTTAGMLTLVFSDKTGQSSDSILDIEPFLQGLGMPYQTADWPNIYRQVFYLLDRSEKLGLPHALVIESSEVKHLMTSEETVKRENTTPVYRRNINQRVLCPFFVQYQHSVLDFKIHDRDWRQISLPATPRIPGSVPDRWKPLVESYSGLFRVFQQIRGSMVTGETGISSLFACEPYNCIDITTCLGGSIPLAVGACLAGQRDVWAVTGDFAFIGAGHLGLLEAQQRGVPLKVLILYNGESATTGGQPIPENTLETVLGGYRDHLIYIAHPGDNAETTAVLRQAQLSREMTIVIADYRKK
jgi:TPP-dependent indolepyruvate ferredoxin oxidoreductase alpha subunit